MDEDEDYESGMSENAAALKPPLPDSLRQPSKRGSDRGSRHALVGVIAFVLFMGTLFAMSQLGPWAQTWTDKFLERGWTPYLAVFLTFWAVSILAAKYATARRREDSLDTTYIPVDASLDTPEDINALLSDIDIATNRATDDLLGQRVRLAVEHFVMNRSIKEVRDILRAEGDADFERLENSLILVRSFVWAIPILGFVGTVLGVGAAVGGFASFLGEVNTVEQIRGALGNVTAGLAVAFDTTFVALVLALIVSMVMSPIEKLEHGVLCRIHEFCQKDLVRSFPTEAAKSKSDIELVLGTMQHMVNKIGSSSSDPSGEMEGMFRRLSEINETQLEAAGATLQGAVESLSRALHDNNDQLMNERRALQQSASEMLLGVQRVIGGEQEGANGLLLSQREAIERAMSGQKELVDSYVEVLESSNRKFEALTVARSNLDAEMVRGAESGTLSGVILEMRATLDRLGDVLRDLSDKPLAVDVHLVAGPAPATSRDSST